jgi:hypothetical protein
VELVEEAKLLERESEFFPLVDAGSIDGGEGARAQADRLACEHFNVFGGRGCYQLHTPSS